MGIPCYLYHVCLLQVIIIIQRLVGKQEADRSLGYHPSSYVQNRGKATSSPLRSRE